MNNNHSNFEQFIRSLENEEFGVSLDLLDCCLSENSIKTLRNLYHSKNLFSAEFCQLDFADSQISPEYKILFEIIQNIVRQIEEDSAFLKSFSKQQLLQGGANHLEKRNAELKYNESYSNNHLNDNADYLETERQTLYSSSLGIRFQEILERFYAKAYDSVQIEVLWDLSLAEKFSKLFATFSAYSEVKDMIELHLFAHWSLEAQGEKTIRVIPPVERKDDAMKSELVNQMKLKMISEVFVPLAENSLLKGYLKSIHEQKSLPKEHYKYLPNKNNEEEMNRFGQAFLLDTLADIRVEKELILFNTKYFPGAIEMKEINLDDGSVLPLYETFRILAYLTEMSKTHIKKIDKEYSLGVKKYTLEAPFSHDAMILEKKLQASHGNKKAIQMALKEHYTDEVRQQQNFIISNAQNSITNEHCFICLNYENVIQDIQWINQYDSDLIRKVIDLFIFNSENDLKVINTPFFRLGKQLCWFPNAIAYTTLAENLIEILLKNELIDPHRKQTELFEQGLKNIFKHFGYHVIANNKDKTFYSSDGKKLGDFDLLAWQNGHIIHLQLKITHGRQTYFERYEWRRKSLGKAALQLKTGNDYISNNPNHIRNILRLDPSAEIKTVSSFIISNSNLFDHEIINNFPKISFHELLILLTIGDSSFYNIEDYVRYKTLEILNKHPLLVVPSQIKNWAEGKSLLENEEQAIEVLKFVKSYTESLWENGQRDLGKLVKYLNENRLFGHLNNIPTFVKDMRIKISDYIIIRPGLVQRTMGVVSEEDID